MPAWKCGCAGTGQLTATRATRATRLIPTALGSPPVRRTARARPNRGPHPGPASLLRGLRTIGNTIYSRRSTADPTVGKIGKNQMAR